MIRETRPPTVVPHNSEPAVNKHYLKKSIPKREPLKLATVGPVGYQHEATQNLMATFLDSKTPLA